MTPTATILIVDDERQNRRLLEALLRPKGYLTRSVASGAEALASIAEQPPDLILLDGMMPGMDGNEVAGVLKANPATANIPIIMVTAQIDPSARLAALDAGVEEFLIKPIDRAELWLRVRNLLRLKAQSDLLQNHGAMLEQQVRARTAELQRFRTAMDATADAILLVDRDTMRFVEVNATASKMLGYTREELFEMGPSELGVARESQMAAMDEVIIGGDPTNVLTETEIRCKDGSSLHVELHRHAHRDASEWTMVGVVRDVTERREAEKRLHQLAHYDSLTGLPNRTLFYETLKKALIQAGSNGWRVGVLGIDLDKFKDVNDTLGHAVGDELLRQFSDRVMRCVRIRDTVGRLGGDEFAVILLLPESQQDALVVANKIHAALRPPFDLNGHEVSATASIGIAVFPDDASDSETLLKYADNAMYRAKQAGRDTSRFFTAQMNVDAVTRLDMEAALRKAVEKDEFVLHYQPKVRLDSGRIAGFEALLRWQRPGHGLVCPPAFIPLLEETGLIVRVGSWVIATACKQIASWMRSGIGPVQISVNVSGRQFTQGNLDADIAKALADNAVPSGLLELELTESTLMVNTERTIESMQNLRKLGVKISIDDFGTGYSSLAYLRRFPIDKLKIDIAFIRDITSNADDANIALAIIHMAHSLKLEVVAEGVETAAQVAYLRRHHCDQIQGYYFSRPVPVEAIVQMLREEKRVPQSDDSAGTAFKTLLLLDDDPSVLASLEILLRQDGYRILTASTAAEGFELLALNTVQVVMSGQRLPAMSGNVFLERVKHLYPDTVRIALWGYSDLESVMEAVNCGAIHRVFSKPWENAVLRDNLREAFRHHALMYGIPHVPGGCHGSDLAVRGEGRTALAVAGRSRTA